MHASTIVGLLGASVVLLACASEPGERDPGTGAPMTTSPDPGSTSVDSATSVDPPATTTAPGDGTTTAPGPTSDDAAETDPGIYFDLGSIPDMPMGEGCESGIDIVFVMDVSTSMGGFIAQLANEILEVDAAIQALDLPTETHYGLAVFVDDAALLNAGAPYDDAAALQADFIMWSNFTASNEQVGGGNPNYTGFQWRPAETTTRIVIHTTDDTFWDGPTNGNGVAIQHGYDETVQALQDATVRAYSFANQIGGACGCDDVTPGWSTPYMGMLPMPEATDGGVFDINQILGGTVSLADAINTAVEESYCDPYEPQG
jgi:hypothetical protein